MTVTLVTFSRKGVRKEFPLEGGSLVIGRKTDADLRIPVAEVSRSHCEVCVNGEKAIIRDLGSSNGTIVNDQKIAQATLKPGDRVMVGPVVFTVQIDGVPSEIAPPEPDRPSAAESAADAPTLLGDSDAFDVGEDLDIDSLEELDLDDVSDLDLGDLGSSDEIEEIEVIDED